MTCIVFVLLLVSTFILLTVNNPKRSAPTLNETFLGLLYPTENYKVWVSSRINYRIIFLMVSASISYWNFKDLLFLFSEILNLDYWWIRWNNAYQLNIAAESTAFLDVAQPVANLLTSWIIDWLIMVIYCVQVWLFDKHKGQIYHGHNWSWCQRYWCPKCKLLTGLTVPFF